MSKSGSSTNTELQQELDQAIAIHRAGNVSQAEITYLKILETEPENSVALHMLGVANHQRTNNEHAAVLISKAVAIDPNFVKAHFNLGVVNQALNKLPDAEKNYNRVLELTPDNANAYINLGMIYKSMGQLEDATNCYNQAIALNPNSFESTNNMGVVYLERNLFQEAKGCFLQALDLNPKYTDALINLATTYNGIGELGKAQECCNDALKTTPDSAAAYKTLGTIMKNLGKMEEAVEHLRHAIFLQPDFTEAYLILNSIHKPNPGAPIITSMEQRYNDPSSSVNNKILNAFGLAEIFDNQEDYSKAFAYMYEANRLKRENYSYDIEDDRKLLERIKEVYQPSLLTIENELTVEDETPIFILGMMRSGTSLTEQILASHPDVTGAGELSFLKNIVHESFTRQNKRFPESIKEINDSFKSELASQYLKQLREFSQNSRFITDKMPSNFLYIGLIKQILPNARIIHMQRNPMDTCLSIFSKSFAGIHHYAYDLEELGAYYRLYQNLMDHWREVLPGEILDVNYERLTENPEQEIRRILDFCDLSFNDACLNFHKSERAVITASATQVRKPMYKTAIERWRNYETELEPLRKVIYPSE
ncbi:MAG: tetratricopeptide repeat protein [Rhodospirillales bacterium]|jgi:tetratricopeptide (TPR) repeat protein|nr:tetratricopeptide repeat protein [Rhodospirillales bacterium]